VLPQRQTKCANDNAPIQATKFNTLVRPTPAPIRRKAKTPHERRFLPGLSWIIPFLVIVAAGFILWEEMPLKSLFWPSILIGTILMISTLKAKYRPELRNISSLLMTGAFSTAIAAYLSDSGFTLIGVELLILISTLAILIGWVFQSKSAILLSVFSNILYLTSLFPELGIVTGIGEQTSHLGAELVPWLILGQILLAQHLRSPMVLIAAITTGYIWLIYSISEMLLEHMAGISFVIAATHYWYGKWRAENAVFGADIHRMSAWCIAIGAALFVQSIWLNTAGPQIKPYETPSLVWWSITGAATFCLFVISLRRYKTSHLSLFGTFALCAATLLLSVAAVMPEFVRSSLETVPGLNAHPSLGFVIGAAIIASGFYWLVGGLKSGRLLDMSMGAIVIGIQATILFKPEKFNADLGVIFVVSLICTLCVGGLVAGATSDQSKLDDNFA
jgi:hypothetical protein